MKKENIEKNLQKYSGILNLIIVLIFLLALAFVGFKVYKLSRYQPKISRQPIQLNENEESKKIESIIKFTEPVTTNEPTGRSDPMAPF